MEEADEAPDAAATSEPAGESSTPPGGTLTLRKVALKEYRGIAELDLAIGTTTVLIGENNIGKTTVLAALDAALGQRARRRGLAFGDYDHRRAGSDSELPDGHRLEITVTFHEDKSDEWNDDVSAALSDVIQLDDDGRRWVVMRVSSTYDATERTFTAATAFLNLKDQEIPARPAVGSALRRLAPVFYVPADRDAESDFRAGGQFWAPFLRDLRIPADVRADFERRLSELNAELIGAAPTLDRIRKRLEQVRELVDVAQQETAFIEPVPGRVSDLLRRTEVRIATASGARVPLARHGGGTQNVAVLALFRAYLESVLRDELDPWAGPILAIEEPEAHLHPAAARSAWALVEALPGQRIVATHSGDLLARAPLTTLRRLARVGASVTPHQLTATALDPASERKLEFHVRRSRSELLFARVWLLGEGETEYWVFQASAEGANVDLERSGVRVVDNYAQSGGPGPLVTLADELGIAWHVVCDGDDAGHRYAKSVRDRLDGRDEAARMTSLPYKNMEHCLCSEGFLDLYEAALAPEQAATVTAGQGTPERSEQVALAIKKQKTAVAAEVADLMRTGARPVPPTLAAILSAAVHLGS
jgi:putative ATP-dependent endonuclease of OLD family